MPFTNDDELTSPKRFASSTASLIETLSDIQSQYSISNMDILRMHNSTLEIRCISHPIDNSPIIESILSSLSETPLKSSLENQCPLASGFR